MSNEFGIDYAAPGFCTLCHTAIANFKGSIEVAPGVYRPNIISLKSNFRTKLIELSNGTFMSISLCDKCENFTPEDCEKIMASEVAGWNKEIQDFKLDDKVKAWHEKSKKFAIVDVPEDGWTDEDKLRITKPIIEEQVEPIQGEDKWVQSQEPTPTQLEP